MPKTKTDPIWLHWTHISGDKKKERVQCNHCKSHIQLKNAPKCKRHTIKCDKTPIIVKRRFIEEAKDKTNCRSSNSNESHTIITDRPEFEKILSTPSVSDDSDKEVTIENERPSSQLSTQSSSAINCYFNKINQKKFEKLTELFASAMIMVE